jgi:hypothetical protein
MMCIGATAALCGHVQTSLQQQQQQQIDEIDCRRQLMTFAPDDR